METKHRSIIYKALQRFFSEWKRNAFNSKLVLADHIKFFLLTRLVFPSKKNFFSYHIEEDELQYLVFGKKRKDDLGGDSAGLMIIAREKFYHFLPSKIDELISFFGNSIKKLDINLFANQSDLKPVLENMGFQFDSYGLLGDVDHALEIYQQRAEKVQTKYQIKAMSINEIPNIIALENKCHRSDPTSRLSKADLDGKNENVTKMYRKLCKKKTFFLLYDGLNPIGGIAFMTCQGMPDTELIATIFVSPDYQGQGLSSVLYLKMLSELKKKNRKFYIGFSSTEKVLAKTNILKRKEVVTAYSFPLS